MSEQAAQETVKAAAAFQDYCNLGSDRSLHKLAVQKHGESTGKARVFERQCEKWSSQHHWQERVKQYDKERAAERRKEDEKAVRDMFLKHINADVEPTAASQVRAGQIYIEQLKLADEVLEVKEELKAVDEILRQAGLK